MAEPIQYPDLNDATLIPLRVLRVLHNSHPNLLDLEECPYTEDQKSLLRGVVGAAPGSDIDDRSTFLDSDEDRSLIMERQIALTLDDMRKIEKTLGTMDQKDKIAFLKAKPGLLEKLLELQDKNLGQRAVGDFMKRMYAFIDSKLDADQRTALIRELGAYANVDK